jgi:hypothetical protein
MPVDTMCSSSLTAVHEACEHIHQGDCEVAIAGGVNLYLHPSSYIGLCGQHMLSRDGKCKSFGKGGNGFVPGEGVGTILLKSLSKAVADGDHIYAIIRSTSINHGGKTNGYTVPSPVAQGEVIRAALDKAGIDARTVTYIEAHGTGTELGDPIEIAGLTNAFRKDSQDTGYCAVGSVKSNMGHMEAAAGIAGIAKIVMQLKHKKLVPSLHSKELNPNIDFDRTPFVVQQELSEWKCPVIKKGECTMEYPRIAGISSFGAGGSNAHVIIEEYIDREREQRKIDVNPKNPAIVVLSARNEDRLKEQVQRLLDTLNSDAIKETELAGVAYTLQVGREAMEERIGVIAGTMDELKETLKAFLEGRTGIQNLYKGQVKGNKEALSVFSADEDMEKTIEAWISKGKYAKIAEAWVKGINFDWNKLYRDVKPIRVSLPTYPFARERYWIPEIRNNVAAEINHKARTRFSLKHLPAGNAQGNSGLAEQLKRIDNILLKPVWIEKPVLQESGENPYMEHTVILCRPDGMLPEGIEKYMPGTRFIVLKSLMDKIEEGFEECALKVFEEIKEILIGGLKGKTLVQTVIQGQAEQKLFYGLSGMLKSARAENPKLLGQIIEVESTEAPGEIAEKLKENGKSPEDIMVSYRQGKRYTAVWDEAAISQSAVTPWKDKGVYLITGGAGGLGLIFAKEITRSAKETVLILTGRSAYDKAMLNRIDQLTVSGARVVYRQADVTDRDAVYSLIEGIRNDFGRLDGIIHSAGIIMDNYIIKKTAHDFREVLSPKVKGLVNLDMATSNMELDFFILFSSISGSLGSVGQVDYSTANAFMDAYAVYRNTLVDAGKRRGKTLSINWPLWKHGGMHMDEETEKTLWENSGLVPMQTETGIKALYRALSSDNGQIMVLEGELDKIRAMSENSTGQKGNVTKKSDVQIRPGLLKEETLYKLKGYLVRLYS